MRSPPFSIPNDRTSCFTHTEDADKEDDEEAAAAEEEEEEEEEEAAPMGDMFGGDVGGDY